MMIYLVRYSFNYQHKNKHTSERLTDKVFVNDRTLQGAKVQVTRRAVSEDLKGFKIISAEVML
ncbi:MULTISPECIES: hypothetical protein [unclassified Shewanella]|uniref:hypothetical protein n=2 Tax=unclassified Shewanella TaxID=196818 RepID=UPI0011AEBE04|nr:MULTISPECIES: hypothetical protein [unclassified Shewanella]